MVVIELHDIGEINMTRIEQMKQDDIIKTRVMEEDHFHVPYEHLSAERKEILIDIIHAITGRRPDDRWAYFAVVKE